LRWLEAAAEDEWPLWKLGEMYYPNVSQAQQSARAPVILHFCLTMLAEHFGVSRHRFSVSDVEMVIRTMRVTIEVQDTILKTA
jgi:hypothetical protein